MKRRKKRAGRSAPKIILFAVALAAVYVIWTRAPGPADITLPGMGQSVIAESGDGTRGRDDSTANPDAVPAPPGVSAAANRTYSAKAADTRYLELINHAYGIRGEPEHERIVPAYPTVPVIATSVTLHETALEAVRGLFDAAEEANAGSFYVSSGYRDYTEQRQTYDEAPDKSFVALPNHSEHQTGLAADIMVTGLTQYVMAASPEGQWLAENAWAYGLLLRYPEDKQAVTGIAYEPWHFRYVGQPHAWYCWEHNLCLEEYIQFLKDSGGYSAALNGKEYSVLYDAPGDSLTGGLERPDSRVSGDNTGGYIVTTWE